VLTKSAASLVSLETLLSGEGSGTEEGALHQPQLTTMSQQPAALHATRPDPPDAGRRGPFSRRRLPRGPPLGSSPHTAPPVPCALQSP
jgi:hypothetical protein